MNKRIIVGIIIAVLIIAAAILIKTYGPTDTSHTITLPSPTEGNTGNTENDNINRVQVTAENVQSVLGTLKRADSYTRTYKLKSYWEGGVSETTQSLWKKGDKVRVSISQENYVKNILVSGNDLYIWYDGYSGIFHSKLAEGEVNKEIDKLSRLVTYEDVLSIPPENIIKASYEVTQTGEPCIYVEYKSGILGYVNHLYVSIDSGLLVSSSRYEGDKLIDSIESVSTDLSTPPDDTFNAPTTGKA